MSTSAQQVLPLTTAVERRFYPRILPLTPIFVTVGENDSEESLLLNVSENGLLVSTPTGLKSNSAARLSLPLNGLPKPVQVTVRVLWASKEGNLAGIQLLNLSRHDRQQIRKWGTRESANSWQPERDHPSLVVPIRTRRNAVETDAAAVTALIIPAFQYCACHRFHTSMTCVVPHATMKTPKSAKIQLKGRSVRLRMNRRRVTGMAK